MYLRYLCASGQRHEVPDLFSFPVAATLVHVLVAQVELELGDVDEDIEEMTDLCDDLLNSDISTNSLIGPIVTFVKTFHGRVKEPFETQVPSENGIGCLRTAIICLASGKLENTFLTFLTCYKCKKYSFKKVGAT